MAIGIDRRLQRMTIIRSRFLCFRFSFSIAGPQLPVGLSLSGEDAIREAVLENAYDEESQTMTLQCYIDVNFIEEAMAELGMENVPLQVQMPPHP